MSLEVLLELDDAEESDELVFVPESSFLLAPAPELVEEEPLLA